MSNDNKPIKKPTYIKKGVNVSHSHYPQIRTIKELQSIKYPDKPCFRELMDQQEKTVLWGPSNTGKSILATNTAFMGALGTGYLLDTWEVCLPVKTLILQEENSSKSVQNRILKMFTGCPEWEAHSEKVAEIIDKNGNPFSGKVSDPSFREYIKVMIKQFNANLLL